MHSRQARLPVENGLDLAHGCGSERMFEPFRASSTMTIPVCKRYRCGSLVGLRLSDQWHAAIFIAGRDHECHNCHLVELSIATPSTDGETAPIALTYESAVPSARKCTTVSLQALRSRGTARRPSREEIARTLSGESDKDSWTWRRSSCPVSGYSCRAPEDHLRHEVWRSLWASSMLWWLLSVKLQACCAVPCTEPDDVRTGRVLVLPNDYIPETGKGGCNRSVA